jgi:cardiolipin synthase A/B
MLTVENFITEINWLYALFATLASWVIALFTSAHVILYKRDVRAAIGWVGIIWLTPFIGSLLYVIFGINRLKRKAIRLLANTETHAMHATEFEATDASLREHLCNSHSHLAALAQYVVKVSHQPLLSGNAVQVLPSGNATYSAMWQAIENAQQSVVLETYIFDNDRAGKKFVEHLAAAKARGVEVYVIIDDVGVRYTWPTIRTLLRQHKIPHTTFLPTLIPWKFHYSNLRSHRKILVVDGHTAFTGGMNIRAGHVAGWDDSHAIEDLHFQLQGPIAGQLYEAFALDWEFCTGEPFREKHPLPSAKSAGNVIARGIADGPDHNSDKIRQTFMGALACAQHKVTIVTPYFLPDVGLINALNTADLRGVDVKIILPAVNNLALVQWASTAMLWQVLERGVQIWLSPPPFDHTKLILVDDAWACFGSANWDPRSLRLNFEYNVECYDKTLVQELNLLVAEKIRRSRQISLHNVDSRKLWVRLRDGLARLMSPYL